MATLGNRVGPKQWDVYDKTEVDQKDATKADLVHAHVEADITDLDKYTKAEVDLIASGKQDALVSGTNIKTINGESLLGTENIQLATTNASSLTSGTLPAARLPMATSTVRGAVRCYNSGTTGYIFTT